MFGMFGRSLRNVLFSLPKALKNQPKYHVPEYITKIQDPVKLDHFAEQHASLLHKMRSQMRRLPAGFDRKVMRRRIRKQRTLLQAVKDAAAALRGNPRFPRLTQPVEPVFKHDNKFIEELVQVPEVHRRK